MISMRDDSLGSCVIQGVVWGSTDAHPAAHTGVCACVPVPKVSAAKAHRRLVPCRLGPLLLW